MEQLNYIMSIHLHYHYIKKCLGPHATGCMELMTEYSSEGCFSRIFYPINIPPNELEVCIVVFFVFFFN